MNKHEKHTTFCSHLMHENKWSISFLAQVLQVSQKVLQESFWWSHRFFNVMAIQTPKDLAEWVVKIVHKWPVTTYPVSLNGHLIQLIN